MPDKITGELARWRRVWAHRESKLQSRGGGLHATGPTVPLAPQAQAGGNSDMEDSDADDSQSTGAAFTVFSDDAGDAAPPAAGAAAPVSGGAGAAFTVFSDDAGDAAPLPATPEERAAVQASFMREASPGLRNLAASIAAAGADGSGDGGVTFNTRQAFQDLDGLFSSPAPAPRPAAAPVAHVPSPAGTAAPVPIRDSFKPRSALTAFARRTSNAAGMTAAAAQCRGAQAAATPPPKVAALGRVSAAVTQPLVGDSSDEEGEGPLPQRAARGVETPRAPGAAAMGLLNASIASLDSSVASSQDGNLSVDITGGLNLSAVPWVQTPGGEQGGSGAGLSFAVFADDSD